MNLDELSTAGRLEGDRVDPDARIAALESEVAALKRQLASVQARWSVPASDCFPEAVLRALDAVDALILILDFDGVILFFNRACERVLKLSAAEVTGKHIWELFVDDAVAAGARQAFEQVRLGPISNEIKRFAPLRSGELRYLECSSCFIDRGPDRPPYVLLTGADVTKRHQAERALKAQLRLEQLVVRLSQMLVRITPRELEGCILAALAEIGTFLELDGCCLWLLADDEKTVVERHRWDGASSPSQTGPSPDPTPDVLACVAEARGERSVLVEDVRELPAELRKRLPAGGRAECSAFFGLPLLCADRTIGWLSGHCRKRRTWTPEVVRTATVVAELVAGTIERIGSQQALRQSEERMRAVVQNMPVMMVAIESPPQFGQDQLWYNLIVWNQECERVTGYRAEELLGNPGAQLSLFPSAEYMRQVQDEWRELGDDFRHKEWQIRARDGTIKTIAWSNMSGRVPIPGWGGWGIGIDVTEQAEARAALRQAHDKLEQRVALRTEELLAANERLRREIEGRQEVERTLVRQTRILRAILDSIADGVAVADESGRFVLFNRAAEKILHLGPIDAPPGEWPKIYGLYLPDCRTPYPAEQLPLVQAMRGQRGRERLIYVNREHGPRHIWLSVNASPVEDESGLIRGGVAVFRDITENKQAHEQLRSEQRLLQQLLRAHERDRQLLAYEIHDGLVQEVTGALMHLETFYGKLPPPEPQADQEFKLALKLLRATIDEARRVISGLRPPILDEQGIVAAVEYLINEHTALDSTIVDFQHAVQAQRFDALVDGTIYRIVQEALSNIRRHSRARRAAVSLTQAGDRLRLEVRDDGVGFDLDRVAENRFGLEGIRERARLLRGTAQIESAPGRGTRILVDLPAGLLKEPATESDRESCTAT
jgi:PAS domain S-box-containing protein